MQDRPEATDLLEAVEDFLRGQSNAASDRWLRFQLLVAANTLGIVRREMLYEDGFLLSEVALGDGFLDIPKMVADLQARDPEIVFALEMITREPLQIPVFTDQYWITFDDEYSPLPGRDLARMLDIVRKNPPKKGLTRTAGLTPEQGLALENDLIDRSIAFARQHLNLA